MAELNWDALTTSVGVVVVVADDISLKRIWLAEATVCAESLVKQLFPDAVPGPGIVTSATLQQLGEYFTGCRICFDLPLSSRGLSRFGQNVRTALCGVPARETITYSQLAVLAGVPGAARAVGRLMAANPFPIVVPCHRVVRSDGQLGDYSGAGGTATKRWLLDFERTQIDREC